MVGFDGPPKLNWETDGENPDQVFQYRVLRYTPNIVRDEWVNIGVVLQDVRSGRCEARVITEAAEMARVARIHASVDSGLIQSLADEIKQRLEDPLTNVSQYLAKLDESLSNSIQMGPQHGLLAAEFDTELNRLYRVYVAPPSKQKGHVVQNLRQFIKEKIADVFKRHRIFAKMQREVPVAGFTQPGDPMKFDFGYQNGVRGFIQAVSLKRDSGQAKGLAYTAARVRMRDPTAEVTAVTDIEPLRDMQRHRFISDILTEQSVRIVPMNQIEGFAEELRLKLQ